MSTVAVVGAAGLVGRALMKRIEIEPDLRGVGLDLSFDPSHDVQKGGLRAALERARPDAIVHLVARVDPPRDTRGREAMRELHERGTRNVARAAHELGAHLVLVSSAVVYGAGSGGAGFREDRPLSPDPRFPYAVDKAAQERVAQEVTSALTIARPAIVYGPGARSYLTEVLRLSPVVPAVDGARPALQFVHVEDLADALLTLVQARPGGAFNVASAGTVTLDELAAIAGKRVVPVPGRLVGPLLDAGARLVPARLRAPSYLLEHLRRPFVLDIGKIERELGWRPKRTSAEAVATVLGAR